MLLQIIAGWLFYFAVLLVVEYMGYYVLQIREASATAGDDLIWGLIHGTVVLHIYYLCFPFTILIVDATVTRQMARLKQAINGNVGQVAQHS